MARTFRLLWTDSLGAARLLEKLCIAHTTLPHYAATKIGQRCRHLSSSRACADQRAVAGRSAESKESVCRRRRDARLFVFRLGCSCADVAQLCCDVECAGYGGQLEPREREREQKVGELPAQEWRRW